MRKKWDNDELATLKNISHKYSHVPYRVWAQLMNWCFPERRKYTQCGVKSVFLRKIKQ